MDAVFSNKIGKNLEVYIDDMIFKTLEGDNHATNLEDILGSVRNYNLRLNLNMFSFSYKNSNHWVS